jgi:hypothetical protein
LSDRSGAEFQRAAIQDRRLASGKFPVAPAGIRWNMMGKMIGPDSFTQNPFAVLTFIVAPAILTNATSVLALSTINRMLRARERMHQMYAESEGAASACSKTFLAQVNRAERQGMLLLGAMRWIYVSLGAFAAASLVTLLGALSGHWGDEILVRVIIGAGLLLGLTGVAGLIGGCANLFRATQLSLVNIREEAALIRARQEKQNNRARNQSAA